MRFALRRFVWNNKWRLLAAVMLYAAMSFNVAFFFFCSVTVYIYLKMKFYNERICCVNAVCLLCVAFAIVMLHFRKCDSRFILSTVYFFSVRCLCLSSSVLLSKSQFLCSFRMLLSSLLLNRIVIRS